MAFFRVAFVALALFELTQAQCLGRIQYPVCAPASPLTVPVTISVEKCAPAVSSGRTTFCTDDLNTLLLLGALGNQQPQPQKCNDIDADQLINKLINAFVYITTYGNGCNCGGQGNGGGNNSSSGNGGLGLTLLGPGKDNLASLVSGNQGILGLGVGSSDSEGGVGGTLRAVL